MLATLPSSPVPSISIHFAAEELPVPEPASPFNRIAFNPSSPKLSSPLSPSYNRDDQLRATHLLPPPLLSPKQAEHQQHLKAATPSGGSGLDQARFQALLQASRSPTGTSKALDLRKEVAWKAHKSKQSQSCFLVPQGRLQLGAAQHSLCTVQAAGIQTAHGVSATASTSPRRQSTGCSGAPSLFLLLEAHPPSSHRLLCSLIGAARSARFRVTQYIAFNISIPIPDLALFTLVLTLSYS